MLIGRKYYKGPGMDSPNLVLRGRPFLFSKDCAFGKARPPEMDAGCPGGISLTLNRNNWPKGHTVPDMY